MMKIFKKVVVALVLLLAVAQFFGPKKNEGDLVSIHSFIEETKPSSEVEKIIKTSCFDCHSNKTNYPWYNNITPVNYWLAEHVNDGKKHLDFSNWASYTLKKKEHKMKELIEEVEEKEMPLNSYTWVHTEARLSAEQIKAIVAWGKQVQAGYQQQMNPK